MKRILYILPFLLLAIMVRAQEARESRYDSPQYIPTDIEDAVLYLNYLWEDSVKQFVLDSLTEEEFLANTHFTTGRYIRNNWIFEREEKSGKIVGLTPLAKIFKKKRNYHPDHVSWVILKAFYRFLKNGEADYNAVLNDKD